MENKFLLRKTSFCKLLSVLLCIACAFSTGITVSADERPQGEWDFNDRAAMPVGMEKFQNNLTLATDMLGSSGMEGDYAFGWTTCAGSNPPQGAIDRNNGEGVKICAALPNDDTVPVVVNYDFMLNNTETMLVCLAAPQVEYRQFTSPVTVENGVITVGDQTVGTIQAGEWHNIGIVYYFTDSGKQTSVYLDGELKVENFADANRTAPSDIAIVAASKAENDGSSAAARGEYLYIDNLYLGSELAKADGTFSISPTVTVKDANVIQAIFRKPVNTQQSEGKITVEEAEVAEIVWSADKKTAQLHMLEKLNGTYRLLIDSTLQSQDGETYLGAGTVEFFVREQGRWDFNDRGAMPEGMQKFQSDLNLAVDVPGASGMEGDYAFGWTSCAGNNPPQGAIDRNNGEGVKICAALPNDDTVPVVVNYDFMLNNTETMLVCLAAPQVEYRQFTSQVTVENGVITVGDQTVGTIQAGEWHNIGIVYYFTDSGKQTSVYLDGELKVENFADANRTAPSDIAIVAASKAENDGSSAAARGEYLYIDNLYLGSELAKADGTFSTSPTITVKDARTVQVEFLRPVTHAAADLSFAVNGEPVREVLWSEDGKTAEVRLKTALHEINGNLSYSGGLLSMESVSFTASQGDLINAATVGEIVAVVDDSGKNVLEDGVQPGVVRLSISFDLYRDYANGVLLLAQKKEDGTLLSVIQTNLDFDSLDNVEGGSFWNKQLSVQTTVTEDAEELKLMVWDGADTIIPLCSAEVIAVQ